MPKDGQHLALPDVAKVIARHGSDNDSHGTSGQPKLILILMILT
jgi:hypothetical protein